MRDLTELTDVEEPAWPLLSEALSTSMVSMDVLPVDPAQARATLLQMQISARSWLGAFVLNCGGVLLDSGWLRFYGSPGAEASHGLPSLAEVNGFPEHFDPAWRPEGGLVIAHDVLGGTFVLNGPDPEAVGRPGKPGEVVYFAPDALRWEDLEAGHEIWFNWFLEDGTEQLYDNLRWPGWRGETGPLPASYGITFTPVLWTAAARRDLPAARRRALHMTDLLKLHRNTGLELDKIDPGFLGDFED
ncbi:DUF2625 domain-containing protein [Streptomyces sp. NBC_01136]|uniref:DUF2625 family protein n=1 Tax=unclassified Streptomyces TaxID=2593676 RepID=UPI00324A32D5|nr:DUF2625 domain-containing protein [Streptomyces sp. NBC_01136]